MRFHFVCFNRLLSEKWFGTDLPLSLSVLKDNTICSVLNRVLTTVFLSLQTVKKLFEIHPDKRPESVSVQGKTYVIKYVTERQLVAFNGNKYLIVCRAKTMCVLAICESRDKCGDAAHWLTRINKRLMEKDFWPL